MGNRIIKFRAIVPVNADGPKSMHYFDLSKIDDCNRLSYADYDSNALMQFTGFADKSGKEVFEGDVLRICNGSINGQNWMEPDRVVTFKKGAFNVPTWQFDSTHWFEVVGNIYQLKDGE